MKKLYLYINKGNYASDYAYSVFSRKKTLRVEKITNSFIMLDGIPQLHVGGEERGEDEVDEKPGYRSEGVVTIRNRGINQGKLFIYKISALPSRSHDVIGNVRGDIEGIEEGMEVSFEVSPERILTIGLSQKEAEELLKKRGIKQEREGDKSEEAIIIDQKPLYTISILKEGKLRTFGITPQKIVEIKLYPEAKETLYYFYFASFAFGRPVGKLRIYKKYRSFVLFEKRKKEYKKPILPENTPTFTKKYSIGVSNMSSRSPGVIGIRLEESDKYGHTGEKFKSVNEIGEIIKGGEIIERAERGEEIYFRIKDGV
ncbi:MAG: methyl-coenzyme M reductase-associated protein Mmp3 [Candidatus Methanospirareceae archaeon]